MSWPMVRLGDVCSEIRDRVSVCNVGIEHYITTDNMLKGCSGVRVADSLPPSGSLVAFEPGDVLTSNIRPYLKKTWLADRTGGCSNDVIVYRANTDGLSPRYLYSVLSSDGFFDYSMRNVSGAKMPRGKRDWLEQFEFPLPPLDEQKRIVEKLEKELKLVDEMKAKFERMEKSAEQYFKSALSEAFENVEGDRVMLGDVSTIAYGYTAKAKDPGENGLPKYLRITDIQDDAVDWRNVPTCECESVDDYVLKEGDIVFARTGATTGKSFLVTGAFPMSVYASYLIRVQLRDTQKILPEYLKCFFDTPEYWKVIKEGTAGAAQGGFNSKKLAAIEICVPNVKVQKSVVKRVFAVKDKTSKVVLLAHRGIQACTKMRKALLAEAFA